MRKSTHIKHRIFGNTSMVGKSDLLVKIDNENSLCFMGSSHSLPPAQGLMVRVEGVYTLPRPVYYCEEFCYST